MELGHWPNESWTKKVNKAISFLNLQRKVDWELCGTENQIFHAIKTSVFHIVQNKSPAIYSIFIWLLAQVSSICFCNVLVNTINYFNIWTIDRIKLLIDTWPQILHMKSGQVKITLISDFIYYLGNVVDILLLKQKIQRYILLPFLSKTLIFWF